MTQCPSVQQLERLLDDQLAGDQEAVSDHVDSCSRCQLLTAAQRSKLYPEIGNPAAAKND